MPGSVDYIQHSMRQSVAESERQRLDRISRAWNYYLGQAAPLLKIDRETGDNDNVRINLSRALVRKGVSWLLGADRSLPFSIDGVALASDNELDKAWDPDNRSKVFNQLGINGGICGHSFVRMIQTDDGIRWIVWDPANTDVEWDDEDIEKVTEFKYTWVVDPDSPQPSTRRQRIFPTNNGKWLILDEESTASGDTFHEIAREVWEYDWTPVFHCQNMEIPNEFWGEADLENDVMDLIDAIERSAGGTQKIVRHKGHPVPYVTGESAANVGHVDTSTGQLVAIPNEDAKAGQWDAAGLEGVLEFYDKLWEAWHYTTRTPPIAFGIVNMSNVAEETVEIAYGPAVEKTWDKRITYGPMFTEMTARALEVAGEKGEKRPKPQWPNIIPRSEGAEATAMETDRRSGIVSKETASERRGYDWGVEKDRLDQEAKDSAETMAAAFAAGGGPPGSTGNGGGAGNGSPGKPAPFGGSQGQEGQ